METQERMKAYQEKQEAKAEYYERQAQKCHKNSKNSYNRMKAISNAIPFGQPILCGHHSEKRHRRDIERIRNNFNKSIEEAEKAKYYEKKAENCLNPSTISSDNPEAIKLLNEKLQALKLQRQNIKQRKKQGEEIPSYVLTNLGGNIRNVEQRIEALKQIETLPDVDKTINGIRLFSDKIDNRIKISFPSIPTAEVRQKLKSNGFRWSPYNKVWQRQLNNSSVYWAESILRR